MEKNLENGGKDGGGGDLFFLMLVNGAVISDEFISLIVKG